MNHYLGIHKEDDDHTAERLITAPSREQAAAMWRDLHEQAGRCCDL